MDKHSKRQKNSVDMSAVCVDERYLLQRCYSAPLKKFSHFGCAKIERKAKNVSNVRNSLRKPFLHRLLSSLFAFSLYCFLGVLQIDLRQDGSTSRKTGRLDSHQDHHELTSGESIRQLP